MKTTLLTLVILILGTPLFAQRTQLSGSVQAHPGNSPFPSVTVTLKDASAKLIAATITNDQGIYQLDAIPAGSFVLTYSFTGFEIFTKAIEITSGKSISLNTVALKPEVGLLSEVAVIGERAAISLKPGKKIFEVGKDIVARAGSITDLLNVVPSVSVSPGGGISLRGNSSVLVLIDGRRSSLTQSNALEQIPADAVERVEVISNPPSRYDASGSAGIINIILKKNKTSGFGGQLLAVAGSPDDTRLNPSLNYKSDNLNLFATYGIRKTDYVGMYTLQQEFDTSIEAGKLNRRQDEQRHDDGKLLYFGMDYQVNAKNSLTAAFLRNATDDHDKTQLRYLYANKDGAVDSSLNRTGESWEQRNYNQIEFNYTRNFETSGKKFSLDMQYDFWNSNKDWNLSTERISPTSILLPMVRTGATGATKDLIVQTDFTLPLDSNAGLAFGLKLDNRRVSSHFIAEQEKGGLWDIIDQIDNRLLYKELIGSAYIEFSGKSGRLSYQAGLRTELTQIGIESRGQYTSTKNYSRLFPTLSLNYNFNKGATLQGSYSKRINRPSLNLIYPFNELTDLTTRFMGNPDLNPSYADVFELSFLQNWNLFTFNPSVYFQNNRDVIKEYSCRNSDNLFITLPVNIDRETRQGIELALQYKPVKWLQMATEINAYRYSQRGFYHGQDFTYIDHTITGRMNAQLKLKNKLAFQAIYNFIGVNATAQTRNTAIHSIDIGVSKTFLKDRITVMFDASNIFELRKFESRTIGADYVISQSSIPNATRYRMTLIYKLNLKNNQSVRQAKSGNRG